MEYRKYDSRYYIRLDKGDELIASLVKLCCDEGISVGSVKGIGGCESVTVGVFDPELKDYIRAEKRGTLEMISLDGNITALEGKPFVHAHACFAYCEADGEHGMIAGHLLKAVIGLTGELVLTPENGRISRVYDEELGIRVWRFDD